MNRINIFVILLILVLNPHKVSGKDTSFVSDLTHRITAEIRPGYNMPTHGFYNGHNDYNKPVRTSTAFHLKYSFNRPYDKIKDYEYPFTYQGIGIAANTFWEHEMTGTPVSLYVFQGARLLNLSERWHLGYEWNLGLSYWWKRNEVVGSRGNIYINVGIPFTYDLSSRWEFQIGPEYTHFSNGDTTYPNGGANTAGLRLGLTYKMGDDSDEVATDIFMKEKELEELDFKDRMTYDLMIYGAWRADRMIYDRKLYVNNKAFPLFGISFNPLYRINRYFLAGPALDIQTDSSSNLYNLITSEDGEQILGYSSPGLLKQTAGGISLRGELEMPFFSVNLGIGYNFLCSGYDIKRFYSTYNLKTFITNRLFACIGYRLSALQYTHNLIFGLGYRF